MSILDKIPFLKKKETEEFQESGLPPMPEMPATPSIPIMEREPIQQQAFQQQQGWQQNTEMQMISAKLDAIKTSLEMLNQRVENLERMLGEQEPRTRGRWY